MLWCPGVRLQLTSEVENDVKVAFAAPNSLFENYLYTTDMISGDVNTLMDPCSHTLNLLHNLIDRKPP